MTSSSDKPLPPPESRKKLDLTYLIIFPLTALLVGFALGFLTRPQVIPDRTVQVVVTATPDANTQAVTQTNAEPSASNGMPVANGNDNSSVTAEVKGPVADPTPTPDIMAYLLSDARHFQGDADAPVTFIEFSDFK